MEHRYLNLNPAFTADFHFPVQLEKNMGFLNIDEAIRFLEEEAVENKFPQMMGERHDFPSRE